MLRPENRLLQRVVVHVEQEGYAPWKMQSRNKWMVDHCDVLLALWDGTNGGTANCIRYAQSTKRPYLNVWQQWCNFRKDHAAN